MYVFLVGIQEVNRSYIMFTALMKLFQIEATVCIEHIFQSHEDFEIVDSYLSLISYSSLTPLTPIELAIKVPKSYF